MSLSVGSESMDFTSDRFWAGTRAPLERSTGLHPAAYTSDDFFRVEQERLFERSWVVVGCAAEAVEGRMLVRRVGDRSVVIVRDGDVIRAFYNSCRHRGTELADGDCDVRNTIRCPYHRWGYGLDGSLKARPFFDEVPRDDADVADLGLIEVRVDAWGPLLFVCLDEATPPLSTWLGDLPERMAGYRMDEWSIAAQQTLTIDANWKLITENFQEYYHLRWVHPELAKVSRVEDHYRYQGPGMYIGQTTTPVSGDDRDDWLSMPPADGLDESDAVSGRHVAMFPNVMFSVLPNHVAVLHLQPLAPGRTLETLTWLVPPSAGDSPEIAQTRDFWVDLNDEDVDICQRSQRGLTHGAIPPGPLAPRFEEPLHRFQNMVADLMCLDDLSDYRPPLGDEPGADERLGAGANPHPAAIDAPA